MNRLIAHESNYRAGRKGKVEYLVIHYTAGDGDTAEDNCRYFRGAGRGASAHYFVDESSVWQSVDEADTAWHCGAAAYRHAKCRNVSSIGIELCSRIENGVYVIPEQTQRRAAALARELMERHGIGTACVLRHYDVTGKNCPAPFVREDGQWENFLKMLEEDMTEEQVRQIVREEVKALLRGDGTTVPAALEAELTEAVARGITDGTRPGGYATRAQVAAMAVRATRT